MLRLLYFCGINIVINKKKRQVINLNTRTFFLLNLFASVFYAVTHNFFPQTINNVIIILIVILTLYTSEKIKKIRDNNPFLVTRFVLLIACIALITTIFVQPANVVMYRVLLLAVSLITQAYELFLNKTTSYN